MDIDKLALLLRQSDNTALINHLYNNISSIITFIDAFLKKFSNDYKLHKKPRADLFTPFDKYQIDATINKRDPIALFRISVLHSIQLLHKLKLHEKNEIKIPKTQITYIVSIADDQLKIKLFTLYLIVYYLESELRSILFNDHKSFVGIDYEFNNRLIALMQINFETMPDININTNSYIWLVNPAEFNKISTDILITYLMKNKRLHKILHGPDSLDIPYMYDIMFNNDKDTILAFTRRLIDTRFLCEYFRLSTNEMVKRCSIYDALKYFNTITDKKFNDLNTTHDSMGPVQDISWNIHTMSSYHILYALYDVLFLKHFLSDIYTRIHNETPQYAPSYEYIYSIIRYIFLERREVTDTIEFAKQFVNPMNNYMIRHHGKNITLVAVFNTIIDNFQIKTDTSDIIDLNFILSVPYFKKTLHFLFKFFINNIVVNNFDVYINKTTRFHDKLPMDSMLQKFNNAGFDKILYLLKSFNTAAKRKILNVYS